LAPGCDDIDRRQRNDAALAEHKHFTRRRHHGNVNGFFVHHFKTPPFLFVVGKVQCPDPTSGISIKHHHPVIVPVGDE
jgi:hypothetical protein